MAVAASVLLGAILPTKLAITGSVLALVGLGCKTLMQQTGIIVNPYAIPKERQCKRMAGKIKGDFVVFLIGASYNKPFKFDKDFKEMGDAMEAMVSELRENPELGMIHADSYAGVNQPGHGPDTLIVQYWKSADLLRQYARSSTNKHFGPWKRLSEVYF